MGLKKKIILFLSIVTVVTSVCIVTYSAPYGPPRPIRNSIVDEF